MIQDDHDLNDLLINSEQNYRQLVENINDLICLLNRYGRCFYISPSCESLLSFLPDEMIGVNFFDYLHPEDRNRFREELGFVISSGKSKPITARAAVT